MVVKNSGYWKDKKRDKYTLKRLSESKYKPIFQYDLNGNFVKMWRSCMHVGKYYNDYKIVNGGGRSAVYDLKYKKIKIYKNNFWFESQYLLKHFNEIPKKLTIEFLRPVRKKTNRTNFTNSRSIKIYKYDMEGNKISIYNTIKDAATLNGIKSTLSIIKCCNGILPSYKRFIWKYGDKKSINKKKFLNTKQS